MKQVFTIKKDNRSWFWKFSEEGNTKTHFTFHPEAAHRYDTYGEAESVIKAFAEFPSLADSFFQIEKIYIKA